MAKTPERESKTYCKIDRCLENGLCFCAAIVGCNSQEQEEREREREREHTLEPDQVQGEQQQQETTTTDDNYMLTITNQDMTIYRACAFG